MIGEICAHIRNFFTYEEDRHIDDWTISGGNLTPSLSFPTDYIRIVGSRLNDGVHKVSDLVSNPLKDESFHGAVWIMSPPNDFIALCGEIEAWQEMNGGASSVNMSPFQSESFGGYSYSKASGASSVAGRSGVPTWQSQYAKRLDLYRKVREL